MRLCRAPGVEPLPTTLALLDPTKYALVKAAFALNRLAGS